MVRNRQNRIGLAACICWVLLTIVNCGAMAFNPAGDIVNGPGGESALQVDDHHSMNSAAMDQVEMDCCDPAELSCCEPASLAVPSKFDNFDHSLPVATLESTYLELGDYRDPEYLPAVPDWNPHTLSRRLHLLNCSFLV
jgi:hypothetical protein